MIDEPGQLTAALSDRYRVERELGAGGMATVYLADDLKHDRKVALKVLKPELGVALGAERFLAEIRTTARLQHPHILPLLDSGVADGLLYYAMPYVSGETLRARLTRDRQLPMTDALRIAREVADALGAAHAAGIVHRDVKPENILLQGGHALVADFGISLAVQQAGGARMTQTGLSLGTPQYMSPEQAMGEKAIDHRTDIYALGAVTYEMLTGEPPFTGATVQAIVAKVLTERPVAPSAVRDTVTAATEHAVLTALAKLPADRFATMAEFAAALGGDRDHVVSAPRRTPGTRARVGSLVPWAVAVAGVTIGTLGWLRSGRIDASPVTRVAVAMPPAQQFRPQWRGQSAALSPDGTRLAYIGAGSTPGSTQVWVRPLDVLEAAAVANTAGSLTVKWSLDGSALLVAGEAPGGNASIVSMRGGQVTPVAGGFDGELAASGAVYLPIGSLGTSAVIARRNPGGTLDTLARVPGGGTPISLTVARDERTALVGTTTDSSGLLAKAEVMALDLRTRKWTAITRGIYGKQLSDGRLLIVQSSGDAFVTTSSEARSARPGAASLGRVAVSANSGRVYPQISVADDGTIAYVSGDIGMSRLTWLDTGGNVVSRGSTRARFWGIALSPDGTRVTFAARNDEREPDARTSGWGAVLVEDLRTGATTTLADRYLNVRPAWSPDGESVLYARVGGGVSGLYERRADASTPERLRVARQWFGHTTGEGSWHPDHRTMFIRTYADDQYGSRNIYAVTLGGSDSTARPVAVTRFDEFSPTPSPDGSLLAYACDESGTMELYVRAWPSGQGRLQISHGGGGLARWSHDGRRLYYWNPQQNLVVVTISRSPQLSIGTVSATLTDAVPELGTAQTNAMFDVAPDGRILVAEPVTNSYQLILVRNGLRAATSRTAGPSDR
jgi:serine/threonine-protein kinase